MDWSTNITTGVRSRCGSEGGLVIQSLYITEILFIINLQYLHVNVV